MDPASVTPSRHACLVNLLSSPVHTTASRHMQAVQYIYSPGPHTLSLLDCSLLWWDFPAFSCMSPCYQSCLFLVLLLCLPLVKDLSFLFLTKVSALTLLIPFCPLRLITGCFVPAPLPFTCLDPAVCQCSLNWLSAESPVSCYTICIRADCFVLQVGSHTTRYNKKGGLRQQYDWLLFFSLSLTPSHRELSALKMTVPVTFRQVLCAY